MKPADREAFNLLLHGTSPTKLTGRMILQIVERDMERARRNRKLRAERADLKNSRLLAAAKALGNAEPYCFRRADIEKATTPAEAIKNALKVRVLLIEKAKVDIKNCTTSIETLRAYWDENALLEALQLAETADAQGRGTPTPPNPNPL